MALGHRLQRRSSLWPLTIAALILWGLVNWKLLGPREQAYSTAVAARYEIENVLLAYDDATKSGQATAWQRWLIVDDAPASVMRLVTDLDRKSLMADFLWVDVALAYRHFAQTTGDPRWNIAALAAMTRVSDRQHGSYYFPQVDAILHRTTLNPDDRSMLVEFVSKRPADWWLEQMAQAHGIGHNVNRIKLEERGRLAGRDVFMQWILRGALMLAGLILLWPVSRMLANGGAAESSNRTGDRARHLRRLWPAAPALLCFALAGMLSTGTGKLFSMSGPWFISQITTANVDLRQACWQGYWLLGTVASIMIRPGAMRWCMAPDCKSLRRVFDLRAADFRVPRWWVIGVAGSGLIYLTFFGLHWGLQKAGISTDASDYLSRSLRSLGASALPITLFLGVVLAPWVEELVYRGFLFTALKNQFGVCLGAFLSSAIFAWSHFYGWFGTVEVFVFGLVHCFVYLRTRCLAASMILHACINFPMILLGWLGLCA